MNSIHVKPLGFLFLRERIATGLPSAAPLGFPAAAVLLLLSHLSKGLDLMLQIAIY
jgi:hypothetical protein